MTITLQQVGAKVLAVAKLPSAWFATLVAYFIPLKDTYILMLLVVLFDFVTGIAASNKKKIPRSSSRLKNSVVKCFCYFGAVFIFWQFEVRLGLEGMIGSYKIIAGFIAIVEIISILENMAVITGKPIFLKLVKLIRGKAREKGGDLVGDILEEKNGPNATPVEEPRTQTSPSDADSKEREDSRPSRRAAYHGRDYNNSESH